MRNMNLIESEAVAGGGGGGYLKSVDWDMCEMEKKNRQTDSTANTN